MNETCKQVMERGELVLLCEEILRIARSNSDRMFKGLASLGVCDKPCCDEPDFESTIQGNLRHTLYELSKMSDCISDFEGKVR